MAAAAAPRPVRKLRRPMWQAQDAKVVKVASQASKGSLTLFANNRMDVFPLCFLVLSLTLKASFVTRGRTIPA